MARDVSSDSELRTLLGRVAFQRHALEQRIRAHPELEPRPREKRCPDSRLRQLELDEARATLVLTSQDARIDTRYLLPLSLLTRLTQDARLQRQEPRPFPDSIAALPASSAAARRKLDEIELLMQRRFGGVYFVTGYVSPKRIRKPNRLRSEWVPGSLLAWFVVHDLETGEILCQTRLGVRSEVSDAPTSIRLKSDVRERLIRELGEELRAESSRALSRMTSVLRVPDA